MKVQYLVGDLNKIENFCNQPFDDKVVNFFDDLSKDLMSNVLSKTYPDILTLAFYLRRNNLIKLKKKFFDKAENRLGKGIAFHITPSNVATNFAYSLFFGLINGNSNIVKVPSKKHAQIEIICKSINKVIKKNKEIQKQICILRYEKNDELTQKLSNKCDLRLVWGGDNTINEIRKFKSNERCQDIMFGNRYSFCIINSDKFSKLNIKEISEFVKKFYIDTFLVDQNGCSSPHLILWHGKTLNINQEKFWNILFKEVKNRYKIDHKISYDKYLIFCDYILQKKFKSKPKTHENYIYRLQIDSLNKDIHKFRGRWGIFFEYKCKNLKEMNKIVNANFQTLTYYGYKQKDLIDHIIKYKLKGIDRVVPVGQSLNINLIWDGYDLSKSLTRIIGKE